MISSDPSDSMRGAECAATETDSPHGAVWSDDCRYGVEGVSSDVPNAGAVFRRDVLVRKVSLPGLDPGKGWTPSVDARESVHGLWDVGGGSAV